MVKIVEIAKIALIKYQRPKLDEMLQKLVEYGAIVSIREEVSPDQVELEQIIQMENAIESLLNWLEREDPDG